MPTSGSEIADEVHQVFARVKKSSGKDKLPYAVFTFTENKTIGDKLTLVVDYDEKYYNKTYAYDELLALLPNDAIKIIAFDFPHLNVAETVKTSPILVSWAPKQTNVRQRMILATSFNSVKASLHPEKALEGEEISDLCEKEVLDKFKWPAATSKTIDTPVAIHLKEGQDEEQGRA